MRVFIALIICSIIFLGVVPPGMAELTGREIVEKTDEILRGNATNRAFVEMTVIRPKWKRTIRLKTWSEKLEKTMVRIVYPSKEQGIGTLKVGKEVWTYIPDVERIIKIAPSMMAQPWMGSDFTYEDIVRTDTIIMDYEHRLVDKTKIKGQEVYIIESIPKPEAPVVWGKLRLIIRAKDFIPIRQEYYDESGKLIRVLSYSNIKNLGGRKFPARLEMRPLVNKDGLTVIRYLDIAFDKPINKRIYTLQNLKSGKYEHY